MNAVKKDRREKEKARIAALPMIRCSCGAVWRGRVTENNPVIDAHRQRSSCHVTVDATSVVQPQDGHPYAIGTNARYEHEIRKRDIVITTLLAQIKELEARVLKVEDHSARDAVGKPSEHTDGLRA